MNSKDKLKLSSERMFDETLLGFLGQHFDFYKKLNDNKEVKKSLTDSLFDVLYKKFKDSEKTD